MTTTWSDTLPLMAATFDGFQERTEQTRLANAIEQTFSTGGKLLGQGGCGIGKSFAALVPAINYAREHEARVVVATATKALQTQYATKDLPTLQAMYAAAGLPFTWAVLKGRGSYVCKAKLADPDLQAYNLASLKEELVAEGHSGDLGDVVTELDVRQNGLLTASSDECPGKRDCPFGDVCFAEQAKARAQAADIVVVNHSVLVTDTNVKMMAVGLGLQTDPSMLGGYDAIVVDEAHELQEFATSALGSELTERGLERFGAEVAEFLDNPGANTSLKRSANVLFQALDALMGRNRREAERAKRLELTHMVDMSDLLLQVFEAVNGLRDQVVSFKVHGNDTKQLKQRRLAKRSDSLLNRIRAVTTADSSELVRWVEREQRGLILKFAPLHVGPFLAQNVWRTEDGVLGPALDRPVVLLSATLNTGGGDFSFIAKGLGLEDYRGFDAGSPFDFDKQMAVWIPAAKSADPRNGFADPSKDVSTWRAQAQRAMLKLITAAGGRALVLFTSTEAMNQAHEALIETLEDQGVAVYKQGDMPNRRLAEEFSRDETSVLFALRSFMTGVDFQGDACRLVIVDKIPFTSPSDVIFSARCDAADQAVVARYPHQPASKAKFHPDGSFYGIAIPSATLVAMQAVGRLIRTKTDRGVVAVLDPRISPRGGKGYGGRVRAALPKGRQMDSLAETCEHLRELGAERDEAALVG